MDTEIVTPGLPRRTVLAGTAWAVPAIAMTASSPAFAGTGSHTLSLSTPNMQTVAAGDTPVTVTVTDNNGQPVSSGVVSFTGPSGVSFSPANPTISNGTASSTMTTTDNWATPGSTLTVTATANGGSTSAGLTVLGANAYGVGNNDYGQLGTTTSAASTPTPSQLSMVFPSPIVAFALGQSFSLVLLGDGSVWSIGRNNYGQLADGTTTDRTSWAKIPTLSGVAGIAATQYGGYALLSDRTVRAWGYNVDGQVGDGSRSTRLSPVTVDGISDAVQLSAGQGTGYVLTSGGTVQTWGDNSKGQYGDGTTTTGYTPITIPGLSNVTSVKAGGYTGYALLNTSAVVAWGKNSFGEVGDGTTTDRLTPTSVSGLTDVTGLGSTVFNGYARLRDGSARAWGYGGSGLLGNGGNSASSTPVTVGVPPLDNVTQVSGGLYSGYALRSGGDVVAWGYNASGQLGDGTTTARSTPVAVQGVSSVQTVTTGGSINADSMFFLR